jgi:hypothetical protein
MASSTTTTSIVLNWTAAGGANSTSQQVQRSPFGAGSWSTLNTLSPSANTYTDSTAVVDTVYDYRIVNVCSVGGPTASSTDDIVEITCVTLSAGVSGLIISGEYGELFNETQWSSLDLLDEGGTAVIQSANPSPNGQNAGPYQFTDAGVDYNTNYIVRAALVAPNGTIKKCDVSVSTGAAPSCDAPTNLSVSLAS